MPNNVNYQPKSHEQIAEQSNDEFCRLAAASVCLQYSPSRFSQYEILIRNVPINEEPQKVERKSLNAQILHLSHNSALYDHTFPRQCLSRNCCNENVRTTTKYIRQKSIRYQYDWQGFKSHTCRTSIKNIAALHSALTFIGIWIMHYGISNFILRTVYRPFVSKFLKSLCSFLSVRELTPIAHSLHWRRRTEQRQKTVIPRLQQSEN